MLRKIDKERLPEALRGLLPSAEPSIIVIGGSVFEICQMSFRDLKAMETAFKDLVQKFIEAKEELASTDDVVHLILDSGVMPEILRSLYEVSEEDLNNVTLPQLIHAINVFMDLNFFSLPSESVQKLQQILGFFINTVTLFNVSAPNTTETPGVKEMAKEPVEIPISPPMES